MRKTLAMFIIGFFSSFGMVFAQQSGASLFQITAKNLPLSFSGASNLELEIATEAFSGQKKVDLLIKSCGDGDFELWHQEHLVKDQIKDLFLKSREKKLLNFEIRKEDSKACQLDFTLQEAGVELARTSVVLKPFCHQPIDFDQEVILSGVLWESKQIIWDSSFEKSEKKLNPELQSAFDWAVAQGLLKNTAQERQKFQQPMRRIELAQMLISLNDHFGKAPNTKKTCQFTDLEKSPEATKKTAELVCQLDLMGIYPDQHALENFMPDRLVDRAQMITVLSRFLWGSQFNQWGRTFYEKHLKQATEQKLILKNNPHHREVKGFFYLILQRADKKQLLTLQSKIEENK